MSFIIYDLAFLVLFSLVVGVFLYTRRKNLKRQGIMYLYRTKVGIRFIEYTGKKFSRILKPLQYFIIASGVAMMGFMLYALAKFSYIYLTSPFIAKALKIPVLLPLIPYLPELFKIDFLPPFYFTYWIIIIAIIAVPHEFSHGIFARLNKIRIHSTGFGFLGPFLAAFVEQNEKDMNKSSKFSQLSVLAAGPFANIITAGFFAIIILIFFSASFAPAGVYFSAYSSDIVNISEINSINNISLSDFEIKQFENLSLIEIQTDRGSFYTNPEIFSAYLSQNAGFIVAYESAPAFTAKLASPIIEIGGKKINSYSLLNSTLRDYKPGDNITIKSLSEKEIKEYNITLSEKNGKAFLGIGITPQQRSGFLGWVYSAISRFKDPIVYYESSLGNFGIFVYDLLWWIILISISVALVNMLPLGPFDGGRFFYLLVFGVTGNEKIAKKAFSFMTWLLLFVVALLMVKWFFAIV